MLKTKNSPLISVIIPVYNVEKYLPRCLDSVVKQTYTNLEIILIDDGSTDNSLKLCQNYAQKDKRIRIFHQENQGVSAARNLGLDKATGEFITFIDSDDWVLTHYVQRLWELIQCYQTDIALGCLIEQYDNQSPAFSPRSYHSACISSEQSFLGSSHHTPVNAAAKLYRKSVINKLRFDTKFALAEDILFFLNALKHATKVASTNEPIYVYCRRNDSATSHPSIQARYLTFTLWQQILDFCQKNHYQTIIHHVSELLLASAVGLSVSILVDKEDPANHTDFMRESLTFLQKHKASIVSCTVMGRAGKVFIYIYIHFPKMITFCCRLPIIRPFLNYLVAKRLARYKVPVFQ